MVKVLLALILAQVLLISGCADGHYDGDWEPPPQPPPGGWGPLHPYLWEGVYYPNAQQGKLQQGFQSFLNQITIPVNDVSPIPPHTLPNNPATTTKFHHVLREYFLRDSLSNNLRMGSRFVEHDLIPRIRNVHVSHNPGGLPFGGFASAQRREIFVSYNSFNRAYTIKTLIHELGHKLGFGETTTEFLNWYATGASRFEGLFQLEHAPDAFIGLFARAKAAGAEREFWDALTHKPTMRALWDRLSPQHMVGSQSQPIVSLADIQLTKAALNISNSTTMASGQTLHSRNIRMMTNLVELFGVPDFSDLARRDIIRADLEALLVFARSMNLPPRQLVFTQFITPATPHNVRWAQGLAGHGAGISAFMGGLTPSVAPDGPPTFTGLNDEQTPTPGF